MTNVKTDEQTKGIQAMVPISLYKRLALRKLNTNETLGFMVQQALVYWLDATEKKQAE